MCGSAGAEETKASKVLGATLAADCDQPGTAAHLAGWVTEAGGLESFCTHRAPNASQCFHGNRKHSALAAYSSWNPAVPAQPQLIFPIECAGLCSCLFAHKKFADVKRGRERDGKRTGR